jgi:DNA-directed RNA polymerase subunit D
MKPEIEILDEKEFKIKFILKNASPALANSFRRAMKAEVPALAVDYVDIYLNSSYFYDEVIAHRLAMLPIKTDLSRFNTQSECTCGGEGCPNCQISFRLNVEGPKVVYSGDFISDDPEIVFTPDNIPVLELFEGQQLMLEAVARLGTGREHAKFQPVSVCAYKIIPEITIKENCNGCKDCIEVCPRNVFEEENGRVRVKDAMSCSMCNECVEVCDMGAIKVEETNNFLFTVEGTGALPIREVMKRALEILKGKAEEMNKIIAEIQ